MRHTSSVAIALLATIALSACSMATMGGAAAGDSMSSAAMSEGDIASIVIAANEGEVQQGSAAAPRATSADVRAFANMMVQDHTAALESARQLFTARHITATDNATSTSLRSASQTTIANLATYSGAAFDRTYMQAQVDLHGWVLRTMDEQLIPSARSRQLRTLLTEQRQTVATHLERARAIVAALPR